VAFTSSDPRAALPDPYTFTAEDNGVHVFSATLNTRRTQSLTATDTVNTSITGTQAGIVVTLPPPQFLPLADAVPVGPGTPFDLGPLGPTPDGNRTPAGPEVSFGVVAPADGPLAEAEPLYSAIPTERSREPDPFGPSNAGDLDPLALELLGGP
jgi:hypothetical protein